MRGLFVVYFFVVVAVLNCSCLVSEQVKEPVTDFVSIYVIPVHECLLYFSG